jgi:O-antigen/teichoic acid export membrane protein
LKDILIRLKQHPKYDTIVNWGKLISITGSAQIIVQAVGFASGILIIRLLPVHEYALYTLANTILGTIVMLSDGGISAAVMSQGGKVWQDKEKLGTVLVTGLYLRRKFALGSLIIAVPILAYLLLHQGASNLTTALIVVSLIPAFFAALSDSLLEIVPKLHQDIIPLQKNQITVGIARLILTGLSVFIFPWTFVAILAAAIPRIYGNIKLRKIAHGFVDSTKKVDSDVEKDILKVVKRVFPTALYHSFSGQIMIWLLSIYGTTTNLAQIGALGRVIIVLTLFSSIVGHLVIPRFSRYENKRNLLLKRYIQINLLVFLFGMLFLFMTWLFDRQILWVLGSNYNNLEYELFLSVFGGVLSLFAGISFVLAAGRSWIISPYIAIGSNLIAIFLGIILFDTSDIIGLLWFNIFISIVLLIQNHVFVFIKIINVDKNV